MPVTIILYKPEHPGNLGSIARVCANFGFESVVLVDPSCEISEESRNMAKRAQKILDGFKVVSEESLKKFDTIIMTHGRECFSYNMKRSMITPRQLAENIQTESNVGIVFGPEGEGLSTEMLQNADIVMSIPTSKEYASMNLAMSVAIVLYELSLLKEEEDMTDAFVPASREHKDVMMEFVDEILAEGDFPSETAPETIRMAWRRMIGRSFLTKREAFALMGFLKRCMGKR